MAPKTKKENYELYHKGAYGNHLRFWASLNDLFNDVMEGTWKPSDPVALRTRNKPGVQLPKYCSVTYLSEIMPLVNTWTTEYGISVEDIVINEIGEDRAIVFQGEVMRSTNYFDLHYSTCKLMMREALQYAPQHVSGLTALNLLKGHMDTPSFDNLERLFDLYPDAIIEFSVYAKPVGNLKLNTVFWEVRGY